MNETLDSEPFNWVCRVLLWQSRAWARRRLCNSQAISMTKKSMKTPRIEAAMMYWRFLERRGEAPERVGLELGKALLVLDLSNIDCRRGSLQPVEGAVFVAPPVGLEHHFSNTC